MIRQNRYFIIYVILSFLQLGIYGLWWWNERGAEPVVGIVSCAVAIVMLFQSNRITYPYLKYYTETHPQKEGEGYYTLVAVWNQSHKNLVRDDYIGSHVPYLSMLEGCGKITGTEIVYKPAERSFSFNKKSTGQYTLNPEYLKPLEYVVLKFFHTEAIDRGEIRVAEKEYVDVYGVDVHLSATFVDSRSPNPVLTNQSDFYSGHPLALLIQMLVSVALLVPYVFFVVPMVEELLNDHWSAGPIAAVLVFVLLLPVFIVLDRIMAKDRKEMKQVFEEHGGKEIIPYVEHVGF